MGWSLDIDGQWGSPAHAGIDPVGDVEQVYNLRFPRTRGDRPLCHRRKRAPGKVPPHTRG